MSSVSEGFVLRKVTSFAATMGLILATIANLPHSASAANRGGLSVADLRAAINRFVEETNSDPKPFVWTADAKRVLAAVKRGKKS